MKPKDQKAIDLKHQSPPETNPPRPKDWSAYLASGVRASEHFMDGVEDLPLQEKDLF